MISRILCIILCVFITCGAGYMGTLPDIKSEFDYKRNTPSTSVPSFNANPVDSSQELKPIPRDDKSFLEIILKKDKTTEYTIDINDAISCLEKLKTCIESDNDIQKFNASISNLIDNAQFIRDKYANRPESAYISYKTLLNLSDEARRVAILRTQAQAYMKYLPYSTSGAEYKASNIKSKVKKLEKSVNQTLYVLKNLD